MRTKQALSAEDVIAGFPLRSVALNLESCLRLARRAADDAAPAAPEDADYAALLALRDLERRLHAAADQLRQLGWAATRLVVERTCPPAEEAAADRPVPRPSPHPDRV